MVLVTAGQEIRKQPFGKMCWRKAGNQLIAVASWLVHNRPLRPSKRQSLHPSRTSEVGRLPPYHSPGKTPPLILLLAFAVYKRRYRVAAPVLLLTLVRELGPIHRERWDDTA